MIGHGSSRIGFEAHGVPSSLRSTRGIWAMSPPIKFFARLSAGRASATYSGMPRYAAMFHGGHIPDDGSHGGVVVVVAPTRLQPCVGHPVAGCGLAAISEPAAGLARTMARFTIGATSWHNPPRIVRYRR